MHTEGYEPDDRAPDVRTQHDRSETEKHPQHESHVGARLEDGRRFVILWLDGVRYDGYLEPR